MTPPLFTDTLAAPLHDAPAGAALPAGPGAAPQPFAAWLPAAAGVPTRVAEGDLQLLDARDTWPAEARIGPLQEHLLVIALAPLGPVHAALPGQAPRTTAWAEGALLLLPAGEVALLRLPAGHHLALLALRPALRHDDARRPGLLQACAGVVDGVALGLAQTLRAALRAPRPDAGLLHHLTQALAAHLRAQHGAPLPVERPGLSELRLHRVLAHLHARLDQPIDLAQAARVAGCSVSHFAHLFKAAMGVSPMRYLRERRMVRARELVETTSLSMGEIALRVGIPEPAQFSQAFRAHWKTPPSQLRRQA